MAPSTNFRRTTSWIGKLLVAVAAVFCLTAAPTSAYALDKDQIIQMSNLGIETESIKGAIDRAGEDFKLTPAEIGELRLQGVDEEIIKYLKEKGHVVSEEGEGDQEGDQTAGGEEGADKPDEGGGDQAAGPAPDDDEGTAPAPTPAPGEKDEEQLSEEDVEERVEQEIEKRKEEQQRQQKLQAAARRLPQGYDALEKDDNMKAARIFLRFLSYNPPEGSDNWYEAKFGLARALFKEGILSGAATPTRQVVLAGADRPHFRQAFRMLEQLTERIGYQPPILQELTKTLTRDLPKDFQNDFNYYLGKFFYDFNDNETAIEYLGKVGDTSSDYPRALYLKGVAQLDPSIDNKPEALRNFERAIRAGERMGEETDEILQMGYLALARVFYEVGLYDVALYYYKKIPRDSSRHAEALFEQAWTYFVKNDMKRALGTFHTLHSPYYEKWYFPDLYILESTVYLNLCQFDASKRALAKFQEKYLDKRPRLKKYLEETSDPAVYWKNITRAYDKGGIARSGEMPKMFVNAVLNDLAFFNIYKVIQSLRNEKKALKANIDSLGEFGQKVLDRVNNQLDTKVREGGILVRNKLDEIDQELKKWELKATQISFDIDSEEKDTLQKRLRNQETDEGVKKPGTTLLIVADDWQRWPFEGEYWFDEVANYRSKQSSQCIEQ